MEQQQKELTAEEVARQLALSQVRQQLGSRDKIEKIKPIILREGNLVRVKILAECRGPVAVEKPFQPGKGRENIRLDKSLTQQIEPNLALSLYGPRDEHLRLLEEKLQVKIIARGTELLLQGVRRGA